MTLNDPEEFIAHCRKDPIHLALQTKFTDETYDFLFDETAFGEASAQAPGATAAATSTMISTTGGNQQH